MISINNVVRVNLDLIEDEKILGDYNTVVYLAPVSLLDGAPQVLIDSSEADDLESIIMPGNSTVIQSIKNYFYNGGRKIIVVDMVSAPVYTLAEFKQKVEAARTLSNNFLYVCVSAQLIGSSMYGDPEKASVADLVDYCDKTESPKKLRMLLTAYNNMNYITDYEITDSFAAVKYSTKTYDSLPLDSALLIGAYFSQIDLSGVDTIKDYSYTEEKLLAVDQDSYLENVTQLEFEALTKNEGNTGYYNFIDGIGNSTVNFGGNLATVENINIHKDFGAAAVERDISYSVLTKMLQKQYLTESGMANIKAAINSQLQRYKTNGYLNVGAEYSGEDVSINYNGKNYSVIKNGTTLPQGFYIFSVPVQNISVKDRQDRKFTPIYVVLETQSGARIVEVSGFVR